MSERPAVRVTVDVPPDCERMEVHVYEFRQGQPPSSRAAKRTTLRITPDGQYRATNQDTGAELPAGSFHVSIEDHAATPKASVNPK